MGITALDLVLRWIFLLEVARLGIHTICPGVLVSLAYQPQIILLLKIAVSSSAGSAVAVAANLVPLTFGTETDGSIAGPAQINAIIGLTSTLGLTSRDGVIPTSETMDTVGPQLGRLLTLHLLWISLWTQARETTARQLPLSSENTVTSTT